MRKLNGITINGEFLGKGVVINGMFRAICAISPIIMREFVLIINKIDALEEAVKICNFNCDNDKSCMDIEFENRNIKGMASLYFKIFNGEPELTDCRLVFDNIEYCSLRHDIPDNFNGKSTNVQIENKNIESDNNIQSIQTDGILQSEMCSTSDIDSTFTQDEIVQKNVINNQTIIEQDGIQDMIYNNQNSISDEQIQEFIANNQDCVSEDGLREFLSNNQNDIPEEQIQEFIAKNQNGVSEEELRKLLDNNKNNIKSDNLQEIVTTKQNNFTEELLKGLFSNNQNGITEELLHGLLSNNKNGITGEMLKEIMTNNQNSITDEQLQNLINNKIKSTYARNKKKNNFYSNNISDNEKGKISNDSYGNNEECGNIIAKNSKVIDKGSESLDLSQDNSEDSEQFSSSEMSLEECIAENGSKTYIQPISAELAENLTRDLADAITQGFQGIAKELSNGIMQGMQSFSSGYGCGQPMNNQFSGSQALSAGQMPMGQGQESANFDFNNFNPQGYAPSIGMNNNNYSGMGNYQGGNPGDYPSQVYPHPNPYSMPPPGYFPYGNPNMRGANEIDPTQMELDALKAELYAIKARESGQKLKTLDEFMEQQKQIEETKEQIRKSKIRIVGSGGRINAKALENGVYVSGKKVYKWGDTRCLDE